MPRNNVLSTPLLELLRACDADEREWLATEAGTSVSYLYHIATCKRQPNVTLASSIISASERLVKKTKGRVESLTLDQLACMCKDAS